MLPGLDGPPEEGPTAGTDLASVVTVFARPLPAHLTSPSPSVVRDNITVSSHLTDQVVALLLVGFPSFQCNIGAGGPSLAATRVLRLKGIY